MLHLLHLSQACLVARVVDSVNRQTTSVREDYSVRSQRRQEDLVLHQRSRNQEDYSERNRQQLNQICSADWEIRSVVEIL